jgi:hypothetical protein
LYWTFVDLINASWIEKIPASLFLKVWPPRGGLPIQSHHGRVNASFSEVRRFDTPSLSPDPL